MKRKAQIVVYDGFKSLSEIIAWLREDHVNRHVKYDDDKEIGVFLSWDAEKMKNVLSGSNVDTFQILDRWFDDDPEIVSLEDYFDENDKPLDEEFAKDFEMDKFTGEEWIEEK